MVSQLNEGRDRIQGVCTDLDQNTCSSKGRACGIRMNDKCLKGTARRETLDLEEDVCSSHNQSFHLVA